MNLDEYLFEKGITIDDFAKKIGYNKCYVTNVKNRKSRISKRLSYVVFKETKGKVLLPYAPTDRMLKVTI